MNEDTENKALAERGLVENAIRGLYGVATTGIQGEIMSFDPTTHDGSVMLLQATLGECLRLSDYAGKTINVQNFYAHDAGSISEDGEANEWTRIVLFDDKGHAYACGSRGVAKSLAVLLRCRPQLPWKPPISVEVSVKTLPGPKLWITLKPDVGTIFNVKPGKKS